MKQLLSSLFVILSLVSCEGDSGGGGGGGDACAPTKDIFSTWTSRDTNNIFAMQTCQFETECQVLFGDAPCSDARGDFTLYVGNDGRFGVSNCADDTIIDGGSYTISCENILTLTYDSDGSSEDFD